MCLLLKYHCFVYTNGHGQNWRIFRDNKQPIEQPQPCTARCYLSDGQWRSSRRPCESCYTKIEPTGYQYIISGIVCSRIYFTLLEYIERRILLFYCKMMANFTTSLKFVKIRWLEIWSAVIPMIPVGQDRQVTAVD